MRNSNPEQLSPNRLFEAKKEARNLMLMLLALVPFKLATASCNGAPKEIEINQPDIVLPAPKIEEIGISDEALRACRKPNATEQKRLEEILRLANPTRYELASKVFVENRLGKGEKVLCREMPDNAVGVVGQLLTEKNRMDPHTNDSPIEKAVVCASDDPKKKNSIMLALDREANVLAAKE